MLEHAGSDATDAFLEIGHSKEAEKDLEKLLIGKAEGPVSSFF